MSSGGYKLFSLQTQACTYTPSTPVDPLDNSEAGWTMAAG